MEYFSIYISLWTNYNSFNISLITFLTSFTFHYELIITEIANKLCVDNLAFTFHYELIITGLAIEYNNRI